MNDRHCRILLILSIEKALWENVCANPQIKIPREKVKLLAMRIEQLHRNKPNYVSFVRGIVLKIERYTKRNRIYDVLDMYVKWKQEKNEAKQDKKRFKADHTDNESQANDEREQKKQAVAQPVEKMETRRSKRMSLSMKNDANSEKNFEEQRRIEPLQNPQPKLALVPVEKDTISISDESDSEELVQQAPKVPVEKREVLISVTTSPAHE